MGGVDDTRMSGVDETRMGGGDETRMSGVEQTRPVAASRGMTCDASVSPRFKPTHILIADKTSGGPCLHSCRRPAASYRKAWDVFSLFFLFFLSV